MNDLTLALGKMTERERREFLCNLAFIRDRRAIQATAEPSDNRAVSLRHQAEAWSALACIVAEYHAAERDQARSISDALVPDGLTVTMLPAEA